MPETTLIQEGVDRVREAFGSIEDEVTRLQKEMRSRRAKIEKRFASQRKQLEKRIEARRKDIEKRTEKLRSEIGKNKAVKRLETLRRDAARQIEQGVSDVLGAFQIASKSDVHRIDRKISQLNKKLKEMDRSKRSNGKAQPTA